MDLPKSPNDADLEGFPTDRQELDELFSLTYEELRRLASSVRRSDARATINPTALVNEAWIKLAGSPPLRVCSPLHLKRVAARAMRQVLVEAARRRNANKRGNGIALVTFDERLEVADAGASDVVALDAALDELARLSPRQADIVETRFFGGLDLAETAAVLQVSEATVTRDWRAAKAWLAKTLQKER
jgi:RNA polymerase sigma factor (TIGR02999 family)